MVPHLRSASLPGAAKACDFDPDPASPSPVWRARTIEQIRNSVLMLDLAAQKIHVMAARISDQQARKNLIGQIKIIEQLLDVARDMAREL
jgi:hypothetical protein